MDTTLSERVGTSIERNADGTARTYSIGELAEEFGVTTRAVRFYEDEGLLAPSRTGATRVYSYRDRARLILICRGKRLGFSLAEIREFLHLYDAGSGQVDQMSFALVRARARIADLTAQRRDLDQTLKDLADIVAGIENHLKRQGAGAVPPDRPADVPN
ncbi:MAG: MerR family transcriptional regulator [Inquilinaceae bacterium]